MVSFGPITTRRGLRRFDCCPGHNPRSSDHGRERAVEERERRRYPDSAPIPARSYLRRELSAYKAARATGPEADRSHSPAGARAPAERPKPLHFTAADSARGAAPLYARPPWRSIVGRIVSADLQLRIHVNRRLTVQESRHKLARDMCHGKRGTIHQAYRDGMEDQLGALGLVLNAIMLRTTKYIDAAVTQLRSEGHEPREEDIARRSPLKHRSRNLLGRYSFTASVPADGALRPLRDPEGPEVDEDDDAA
ncbi:Tn3 family transposase [Streptomyces sp. NPDC047070]|uniref:Tn3 family transposase n=1 Tax=Streptomyces sp. NPDC047070 TaxID=3154923 RepID=UPI003453956A